jgi:hypothetical protein
MRRLITLIFAGPNRTIVIRRELPRIDNAIYIIGGLGYHGRRRFGETPVYRLDTGTLQIQRIETTGEPPGWMSRHRAVLVSPNEIRVWGGEIAKEVGDTESYDDNHGS